jgi:hypothetical protein
MKPTDSYADPERLTPYPRIPAANGRMDTAKRTTTPAALQAIIFSLFLPQELSFYLLGLRLTVTRLILLVLTPVLLTRVGRMLATGRYRFVLSDLFVPLAGLWMIVGPSNLVGIEAALNHGGPIALEFCIGYMATRTLLSRHGEALSFADLLCCGIAIVGLLGVLDTLTNHYFLRDLASHLTGYVTPSVSQGVDDHRLGLLRAMSTLDHPILFGVACAIGLLIATSVPLPRRKFAMFGCAFGALLSLSSAPLQGVVFGFGLLLYNQLFSGVQLRWIGLIGTAAAGIIMLFTFIGSPLDFVLRHFIFDPYTGWFRTYIWQMGVQALMLSPWVGLGFEVPEYYAMPATVDSVWLESALTFGIPGSVLIALSIIGATSPPTSGRRVHLTPAESKLATMLGILIFLIVFWGFTVDYWGAVWILIALLTGLRAHLSELGRIGVSVEGR